MAQLSAGAPKPKPATIPASVIGGSSRAAQTENGRRDSTGSLSAQRSSGSDQAPHRAPRRPPGSAAASALAQPLALVQRGRERLHRPLPACHLRNRRGRDK
jgi:hypothetical protein